MIVDVDADLSFDGPAGSGTIRAGGGRLVVAPKGWGAAMRLAWWAVRRRGGLAPGRRFAKALGLALYLKLPGLPPIGL